jgi:hypothetical protein
MILDTYGQVHLLNEGNGWASVGEIAEFAKFYSHLNLYSTWLPAMKRRYGKENELLVFASSKEEAASLANEVIKENRLFDNSKEKNDIKLKASRFIQARYALMKEAKNGGRSAKDFVACFGYAVSRKKHKEKMEKESVEFNRKLDNIKKDYEVSVQNYLAALKAYQDSHPEKNTDAMT